MLETKPSKTFRGTTWEEIERHKEEILAGSLIEVNVYFHDPISDSAETLEEGLADIMEEIHHLKRDKPVQYSNPMNDKLVDILVDKFRNQGFNL